jgi:phosphate regulon transcriptional regulator PhoB
MGKEKIIIVEDETDIREVIEYNLKREGYETLVASNGEEALRIIARHSPDLVILDLMLPGLDGIDVCRKLKEDPLSRSVPVIMVTAKGEESDVVLGLGMGADDYVTKPFRPRELMGRVRAVLRRGPLKEQRGKKELIEVDGVVIDVPKHRVTVEETVVEFTATEFRILHFLASHPGRVFTRDQLLSRVIGESAEVVERNIDVHVRAVRKKLGNCRELVETVRGIGYRFRER